MCIASQSRAWCEYMYQVGVRTIDRAQRQGIQVDPFVYYTAQSYLVEAHYWDSVLESKGGKQ